MTTTTAPQPDAITWTLTPEDRPGMRSRWYRAGARCPHGASDHTLVAPTPDAIRKQAGALGSIHRSHTGCRCAETILVIEPD